MPGRVALTLPDGHEHDYVVPETGLTLGRVPTNDIVLADAKVSRNHARIEWRYQMFVLVDLGSTTGTRLNGARVQQATLKSGDTIGIGDCTLQFRTLASDDDQPAPVADAYADVGATAIEEAPPEEPAAPPSVATVIIRTPQRTWELPLAMSAVTIGRMPGSVVLLDDPAVSRRHAVIERQGDMFQLRDLESRNGTWLGVRRIDDHVLEDGDTFRIGSARLAFKRNLTPAELSLFEAVRTRATPAQLEIEIDSTKCAKQVNAIVESDFFKELQVKAQRLRRSSTAASSRQPAPGSGVSGT